MSWCHVGQEGCDAGRRSLLTCALLALLPAWSRSANVPETQLRIASNGDELAFVPDRLSCEAGARVRLHFHHAGRIVNEPHDWVLLKPGTVASFIADADRQPEVGIMPPQHRTDVIAATPLCPRGGTVTVTFVAPNPGEYPFICSVPGHGEMMRGTLTVSARAPSTAIRQQ